MTSPSYRTFTGTAAQNYERFFVPTIAEPVSRSLLDAAALQPGERVLDVACGTGVVARAAAEQVGPTGAVAAVDVAADMIEVARDTVHTDGAGIDWRVGDATDLPFPDASYDVVLCQMGLMFVEDRDAAVAEMVRVLAPGGRFALNTPGRIQPPFELMERAVVSAISPELGGFVRAVFSMNDPDAVAALVARAGPTDIDARVHDVALDLPEPAEFLWEYIGLTPMAPLVAAAPAAARARMEEVFVDSVSPLVTGGRIRVDQPVVVVSGHA